MSSFLLRFLGIDKLVNEISKTFDEETKDLIRELIFPIVEKREDSVSVLKELLNNYGLNLEIKELRSVVSESRRLTALASNMTPLNIENPEDVLWKLAEAIRPKMGVKRCQKSEQ